MKRISLYLLMLLCTTSLSFGQVKINQKFSFDSFEKAKKASNKLKFTVVSTKVGLFSSDVDGYALQFDTIAEMNDKTVKGMAIRIPSAQLNTDSGSRDDKLHELCLSAKKYPEIIVKINGEYDYTTGKAQKLPATVNIRGKEKPTTVEIEASSNGDFLLVEAKSIWKLSEMEIPDPSIAVAKLSDEIKIYVKLQLPIKK